MDIRSNALGISSVLAVALTGLGTQSVQAATLFTEIGDAGQQIDSAQTLPGGTRYITGFVESGARGDLFSFAWAGGLFTATATAVDPILHLFDPTGTLLAYQDDIGSGSLDSFISINLLPGRYFLGISGFRAGRGYWDIQAGVLDDNNFYPSEYTITLSTPPVESVPEPASITGLLMIGVLGAGSILRRPNSQKVAVSAYPDCSKQS